MRTQASKPIGQAVWALLLGLTVWLAGCGPEAKVIWSPDGSRGVYVIENKGFVIDADGNVLQKLEDVRGAVWSADSRTLYFSQRSAGLGDARRIIPQPIRPTSRPATQPADAGETEISRLSDGKIEHVAMIAVADGAVRAVSPDGQWLAIAGGKALIAYRLKDGRCLLLSDTAASAVCFTGPGRLAFIAAVDDKASSEVLAGVNEVDLSAEQPEAKPLLYVVAGDSTRLASIGDDLLISTFAATFPMPAKDAEPKLSLFQWTRANNSVTPIAEDLADTNFAVSPDQKRILLHRELAVKDGQKQTKLVVVRSNGSDAQPIGDRTLGFVPTWRGNRQVTHALADGKTTDVDSKPRRVAEVLLSEIDDEGKISTTSTLSRDWEVRVKPYDVVNTTTQPAK